MNQVIGNPVPFRIGKRIYLVSYVSMSEWETFGALTRDGDDDYGTFFLVYSAMHRANDSVTESEVRYLLRKRKKYIAPLINLICDFSMPEMKKDLKETSDTKEVERNVKTIYRVLGKMYSWASPEIVGRMSPAQVYIYLTGGSAGTGIVKMTSAEYHDFRVARGMSTRN